MEWILWFSVLTMTILVVMAANKIDDLRVELKLLQLENNWLREKLPKD